MNETIGTSYHSSIFMEGDEKINHHFSLEVALCKRNSEMMKPETLLPCVISNWAWRYRVRHALFLNL